MPLYNTFQAYVFNLQTTSSAEAKRLWRSKIKEEWDWECAYCGSEHQLTIDHIVPRAKGGTTSQRIVCVPVTNVIKIKHILLWKIGIFHRSFLILTVMKESRSGWNQNHQLTYLYIAQGETTPPELL